MMNMTHTLPDDDVAAYFLAIEEGLIDGDSALMMPRDRTERWLNSWGQEDPPPPDFD
jgi:hypothetical protein